MGCSAPNAESAAAKLKPSSVKAAVASEARARQTHGLDTKELLVPMQAVSSRPLAAPQAGVAVAVSVEQHSAVETFDDHGAALLKLAKQLADTAPEASQWMLIADACSRALGSATVALDMEYACSSRMSC